MAWNLETAEKVLTDPECIYQGLIRDGIGTMEEGLCFVGRPELVLDADGRYFQLPDGKVFAAFVSERRDPFRWELVPASPESPGDVLDWRSRFRSKVWPISN